MQIYIKPLNEYPQSPMDKETTRLLFGISLAESYDHNSTVESILEATEKMPSFQILKHRLSYIGVSVSDYVIAFISLAFPSPGTMMLFTHAIYHAAKPGATFITRDLCHLFPNGFPDDDHMRMAWDAQKLPGGGNGVDNLSVFKATKSNPVLIGE